MTAVAVPTAAAWAAAAEFASLPTVLARTQPQVPLPALLLLLLLLLLG
jgi:hypothetical protein